MYNSYSKTLRRSGVIESAQCAPCGAGRVGATNSLDEAESTRLCSKAYTLRERPLGHEDLSKLH